MDSGSTSQESSNALLHEFSHVKAAVEEKSFEEKFNALSQKIDDFDPVSLFGDSDVVPSEGEVIESEVSLLFSKDINDETLIDDLIKDIETKSTSLDEVEGASKSDKIGTVGNDSDEIKMGDECSDKCELGNEDAKVSERDIIGGNSDEKVVQEDVNDVEKQSSDDQPDKEVSVSTADGIDNGLEVETNGPLTVSTESEGFNEDQNQGESGETEESKTVTDHGNENKEPDNSGKKKTESGKLETASPTKVAKPKKKEDKSIGKSPSLLFFVFRLKESRYMYNDQELIKVNSTSCPRHQTHVVQSLIR